MEKVFSKLNLYSRLDLNNFSVDSTIAIFRDKWNIRIASAIFVIPGFL